MGYVRTLFSLGMSFFNLLLIPVLRLFFGTSELLLPHHSMHFNFQTFELRNYKVSITICAERQQEWCP